MGVMNLNNFQEIVRATPSKLTWYIICRYLFRDNNLYHAYISYIVYLMLSGESSLIINKSKEYMPSHDLEGCY
jgi:hypothetical protein